jgi:hypothetical protein
MRFVADVWATALFDLDFDKARVDVLATKSQDLFREAGINHASTGKMSTKQACRKIDAGNETRWDTKFDTSVTKFIVALRKSDGAMMIYFHDEVVTQRHFTKQQIEDSTKVPIGTYNFDTSQVAMVRDEMLKYAEIMEDHTKQPEFVELKTTKTTPMKKGSRTPQELMLEAMAMLQGGGQIDEAQVVSIVDKRLKEQSAVKVEVVSAKATKRIDKAHKNFADAVALLGLGKNLALIGEAGSGKSFGAIQMAQALDLDYSVVSCHGKMQSFDLVGAMSPTTGQYISTALRDAYENGKVLILDEFDRSNTETTIALNGILAGDCYGFPDGMVKRNPEFRVIACQNTFGAGSSKTYASAKAQDGSTLTRFTRIEWDIDAKLETAICGDNEVTRAVQAVRKNAKDKGYDQILITPRQAIDANQMVDSLGWSTKKAIEFTCLNGLAGDVKKRLMDGVSL